MRLLTILLVALALAGCGRRMARRQAKQRAADSLAQVQRLADSLAAEAAKPVTSERIDLRKELLYDQYTLDDRYPYGDTTRHFQWDKIKAQLAVIEQQQGIGGRWGVLENRNNRNGEPPVVARPRANRYGNIADTLGRERRQGIPLYTASDTLTPVIYGRDGDWVRIVDTTSRWATIETIYEVGRGRYLTPRRYVRTLADSVTFRRVALADRTMEHIITLEKSGEFAGSRREWLIRSMNPATTGAFHPPYQQRTPLGIFVVQEKKAKMFYTDDGSSAIAGFAPWASRFCNGGYIHGVPTNDPHGPIVEYGWSLGTTPRSHMCIRNASSHARFVFDWAARDNALVVVIE